MRKFLIIAFISCYYSTAWAESAVFDYDDFGPQILAYEMIGFQWYQWNSSGGSEPKKTDTIKVVVYWDESIEEIQKKYPVNEGKKKDYRYLSFDKAMEYLDSSISKLPNENHLVETRKKLLLLKNN